MLIPASELTQDTTLRQRVENERIAVQGVIDLILVDEDGNIDLYDYKTDRLTTEELSNEALCSKRINYLHGLQLSYYAKAVEYLFGKSPRFVGVYSTHAGAVIEITPLPLKIPSDIL